MTKPGLEAIRPIVLYRDRLLRSRGGRAPEMQPA